MHNIILTNLCTLAIILFTNTIIFSQQSVVGQTLDTTISVEDARADRDRFLENTDLDQSAFTFNYEQLKKFAAYIEIAKSRGVDIEYVTIYLSQYENGEKTAFIAPLKKDGTPNYSLRVLNHGSVVPPRTNSDRASDEVRY